MSEEKKMTDKEKELQAEAIGYLRKRIAELEEKSEKMKCCGNCKHSEEDNKSSTICDECFELCYWEMKE